MTKLTRSKRQKDSNRETIYHFAIQMSGGDHIMMMGDSKSIIKGKLGALLVIVKREKESPFAIIDYKASLVDGKKIKEDTWYKLENGKFVEVRN
jgi:hypothetical protein